MKQFVKSGLLFVCIYIFWCLANGASTELFYNYCQPKKWHQYLFIPFYNETPQCRVLRWIQTNAQNTTYQLLLTSATWGINMMIHQGILKNKNKQDSKEKEH